MTFARRGARVSLLSMVSLLSITMGVGCAHRTTVRTSAPQSITPTTSYASIPSFAFRDFSVQIGPDVFGVTSRGDVMINGMLGGVLTPDGSFRGRSGVEIARLYPNGTMLFQGALQDTRLEGATMFGPRGPIAFIDQSGSLYFAEAGTSVPVIGITSDSLWTVLFTMGLFGVRESWLGQ